MKLTKKRLFELLIIILVWPVIFLGSGNIITLDKTFIGTSLIGFILFFSGKKYGKQIYQEIGLILLIMNGIFTSLVILGFLLNDS